MTTSKEERLSKIVQHVHESIKMRVEKSDYNAIYHAAKKHLAFLRIIGYSPIRSSSHTSIAGVILVEDFPPMIITEDQFIHIRRCEMYRLLVLAAGRMKAVAKRDYMSYGNIGSETRTLDLKIRNMFQKYESAPREQAHMVAKSVYLQAKKEDLEHLIGSQEECFHKAIRMEL